MILAGYRLADFLTRVVGSYAPRDRNVARESTGAAATAVSLYFHLTGPRKNALDNRQRTAVNSVPYG